MKLKGYKPEDIFLFRWVRSLTAIVEREEGFVLTVEKVPTVSLSERKK